MKAEDIKPGVYARVYTPHLGEYEYGAIIESKLNPGWAAVRLYDGAVFYHIYYFLF